MSFDSRISQCSHHPRKHPTVPPCAFYSCPFPQNHWSMLGGGCARWPSSVCSRISCRWDPTVCISFCLPSFPGHNALETHPCCSFASQQCSVMWTDHFVSPFIRWWAFGLFPLSGYEKWNKAILNTPVPGFMWTSALVPLGWLMSGSGIGGLYGTCRETAKLFTKVKCHFTLPPATCHILINTWCCQCLNSNYPFSFFKIILFLNKMFTFWERKDSIQTVFW